MLVLAFLVTTSCGCSGTLDTSEKAPDRSRGLKVKSTDEIGEFKEQPGQRVVDSKVEYTNPITGPLEAYDPMKQQIAELAIQQAVQVFYATEGRYPRDYDEFMSEVVRKNNVRLPELGVGKRYEYDVENHKLMVVKDEKPQ
ncbi:MAG: hypothetical protein R3C49_14305 [Planctomycetaceae bacterium]